MITLEDMNYHLPHKSDFTWGETTYFDVFIPEANIHAWIYFCFRKEVGTVLSDVEIVDCFTKQPFDVRYMDMQGQIPVPDRMDKFTLPTGLSLDATGGPRNYRAHYIGPTGVELSIEARGLHEPYDIHDPAIDPMAAKGKADALANSTGFGEAYASHFDLTCHVTGQLKLYGKIHDIDCIAVMDHSWGPRPERGLTPMAWVNANFSADFALHGIFAVDPFGPEQAQHSFRHGYVVIDGELRGAVAGALRTRRDGYYTTESEIKLIDESGREYSAIGSAVNRHTWLPYPMCLTPIHMFRWHTNRDCVGYGSLMEGLPIDYFVKKINSV